MRHLLLLLLAMPAQMLIAQKKIFDHEIKGSGSKVIAHPVPVEASNTILLSLCNKKEVQRFLVHPDGRKQLLLKQELQGQFNLSKNILEIYYRHKLITGFYENEKLIEVFFLPRYNLYYYLETDIASGRTTIADTIRSSAAEAIAWYYRRGNSLVLMFDRLSSNSFYFRSKEFGRKHRTDTLKLEFEKKLSKQENAAASFPHARKPRDRKGVIFPENHWLPSTHYLLHKGYATNERIALTYSLPDHSVLLTRIDLQQLSYEVDLFPAPEVSGAASAASYVVDSFLVHAAAEKDALHLRLFNINTKQLEGSHQVRQENFHEFGSRIEKMGNFWAQNHLHEIDFEAFLKKAVSNQLQLTGYREGSKIHLGFTSPYALVSAENFVHILSIGALGFHEARPPTAVSFNASFHLPNFTPANGTVKTGVWDKMLMYAFANRATLNSMNLFLMKGTYYCGNINTAFTRYVLWGFDEKAD